MVWHGCTRWLLVICIGVFLRGVWCSISGLAGISARFKDGGILRERGYLNGIQQNILPPTRL